VVNVLASLEGRAALALGTIVGASLFNLGCTLGLSSLVAPPRVHPGLLRRELPVLVGSAAALAGLVLLGEISRWVGGLLLAAGLAFTGWVIRGRDVVELEAESASELAPFRRRGAPLFVALGLTLLIGGGKLFLLGATGLAHRFGMSDALIGLTVLGIGTALPELAASLVAARRGHPDIAVGNALGSNIFYVLFVLGVDALIRPLAPGAGSLRIEVLLLLVLTLLTAGFLGVRRTLGRLEGVLLLVGYLAAIGVVLRAS